MKSYIEVYEAPQNTNKSIKTSKRIFLAGVIDMGKSFDWQEQAIKLINTERNKQEGNDIVSIYNPRRKDWNSKWKQEISNPQFKQQVEWELNNLDLATHIIMNFLPDSKAPISLLELGLHSESKKLLVVCPKGFYRKGNVDIVCERYNIPQFKTLKEAIQYIFKK